MDSKISTGTWKSLFATNIPESRLTTASAQVEKPLVEFVDHRASGSLNRQENLSETKKTGYQCWILLPVVGFTNSLQDLWRTKQNGNEVGGGRKEDEVKEKVERKKGREPSSPGRNDIFGQFHYGNVNLLINCDFATDATSKVFPLCLSIWPILSKVK